MNRSRKAPRQLSLLKHYWKTLLTLSQSRPALPLGLIIFAASTVLLVVGVSCLVLGETHHVGPWRVSGESGSLRCRLQQPLVLMDIEPLSFRMYRLADLNDVMVGNGSRDVGSLADVQFSEYCKCAVRCFSTRSKSTISSGCTSPSFASLSFFNALISILPITV